MDEYQDTNQPQYELLKLLAGPERNICVVGDEDQSIYSLARRKCRHIVQFAEDFPGAQLMRLEENYRSRQYILDSAAAVVTHNQQRIGKQLDRHARRRREAPNFFEAATRVPKPNTCAA